MGRLRDRLRALVYPGLDLHTRNRASLCRFWGSGPRDVLDAGSGNGYFAWLAYKSGARVTALNINEGEARKADTFLVGHLGADRNRLRFHVGSVYELDRRLGQFDEIICYEALEHVRRHREVCQRFFDVLRPGGVLHLCCPNRLHPRHQREVLDEKEQGGHVRTGYTEQDYRQLLEPIGFAIEKVAGVGPWSVYSADKVLRAVRTRVGDIPALVLLPVFLPIVRFARLDHGVPFSVYVKAAKPETSGEGQAKT